MAVIFLIGGTGNQLFQYARSKEHDKFSTLFLSRPVRAMLGWTQHEQLFKFPAPSIVSSIIALIILCIDLGLAKLFRISLFSTLDLRSLKMVPKCTEFVFVGYAQDLGDRNFRDFSQLRQQIVGQGRIHPYQVVMHVRGGDILANERAGGNTYGLLTSEYYKRALNEAPKTGQILVLTDDVLYANTIVNDLAMDREFIVRREPLAITFELALSAKFFVSSNSTMSYWLLRLRGSAPGAAPIPFIKRGDMPLPESVARISLNY